MLMMPLYIGHHPYGHSEINHLPSHESGNGVSDLLIPRERIIYTYIKTSGIDKNHFPDKTYVFVICLMVDFFYCWNY